MKILITDDDERFRRMLTAWLVKQGHEVRDGDGGPETLELLKRIQCDVVILDLMMPRANGLTLIPEVRRVCPNTPIIVLSAETNTRVVVESIRAGAEACLEKPVDFEALQSELSRLASASTHAASASGPLYHQ